MKLKKTYDNVKIEKKYSLKCIVDGFIKNECMKQKSSDDTKNRYKLVVKEFYSFCKE